MVAETTELEYWRLHIIRRDHKDQLYTIATDESNNLTHSLVCSLVHHIIPGSLKMIKRRRSKISFLDAQKEDGEDVRQLQFVTIQH
ncbi:hypothetical protein V6Z12_D13G071700 [Gossypium hirsutum]